MEAQTYTLNENISWRELGGSIIVVDTESGNYYTMNHTASLIFQWMSQGMTIDDMTKKLSDTFELESYETLHADITEQINEWLKNKIFY